MRRADLKSWVALVCGCALGMLVSVGQARTYSVGNQLEPDSHAEMTRGSDGVQLRSRDGEEAKVFTKGEFKSPVTITAVVKTDSQNLRLYYAQGMAIFNWEGNEDELRYHDPRNHDGQAIAKQGRVPRNTWVTIKWVIDGSGATISVNGAVRGSIRGDESGLSGKVGIGTYQKAVVSIRSLQVTTAANSAPAAVDAPAGDDGFGPVDVSVPTTPPRSERKRAAAGSADPNAIERPEYAGKAKRLVKTISSVTGMAVMIAPDGDERGFTQNIIGTVMAESRGADAAGAGIASNVGPEMRTCFKEAVHAIELRYPFWEPGHIDVTFGEKYIGHEGGSAGTAFSVLMLSMLEGFDVDPKFAVTGDITVDWKVRTVGGITAKLRGAGLDGCHAAAIPEGNETAFADMRLLYGESSMWKVQVFSIGTLQEAVQLLRVDRSESIQESMRLFATLRPELDKSWRETLQKPATVATLKKILELTPSCLSAKYLLEVADGTAPRKISASATIYNVVRILYPFRMLVRSGADIDHTTLSLVTMANARKQMGALRPIAPTELQPLLNDALAYAEAINNVAYNGGTIESINAKAEIVNSRLAAISSDSDFMDKLVREGY